jgi:hypothetical protein
MTRRIGKFKSMDATTKQTGVRPRTREDGAERFVCYLPGSIINELRERAIRNDRSMTGELVSILRPILTPEVKP